MSPLLRSWAGSGADELTYSNADLGGAQGVGRSAPGHRGHRAGASLPVGGWRVEGVGRRWVEPPEMGEGLTKVEACPYYLHLENPRLFDGEAKAARERKMRRHLRFVSTYVGGTEVGEPGEHSCMELRPPEAASPTAPARSPGK